jgi:hypothetical protein
MDLSIMFWLFVLKKKNFMGSNSNFEDKTSLGHNFLRLFGSTNLQPLRLDITKKS